MMGTYWAQGRRVVFKIVAQGDCQWPLWWSSAQCLMSQPLRMSCCRCPQVVAYEYGQESAHLLKGAGANLEFRTYKWMGHEARADELQDIKAFLQSQLNQ